MPTVLNNLSPARPFSRAAISEATQPAGVSQQRGNSDLAVGALENAAAPTERRSRMQAMQRFVCDFARMLDLRTVPRVFISDAIVGSAKYDEATGDILIHPSYLTKDGEHARTVLSHELLHARQHERGRFRFNFPDTGWYLDAPTGPLWKILLNPFKLLRLCLYALQPIELDAELTRLFRKATGRLPPPPW